MGRDDHYIIGFDLGGTKMVSAVLDAGFEIVSRKKTRTAAQEGNEAVCERLIRTISGSLDEAGIGVSQIRGIGLAVPGPLDRQKGILIYTPNLGFRNFALKERIEKKFKVPVFLENDVNAGVYGEFKKGAAVGYRNVIGIFPGTGIGGGLILDGKLFRGTTGNAGEIGHMIIQVNGPLCGCGQYGCVEALASRTALAKDAVALASSGTAPLVYQEAGTDFKNYKSGVFVKAYKKGSPKIVQLIERSAWFLGIAMANCINLLNPEVFVLGGGLVEKLGDSYIRVAEKSMREHSLPGLVEVVKVAKAKLGDDAALVGAANVVLDEIEGKG
ncbi:MAG TPA: ROK family protein [Spirochaetia bacterium]|nr:ROK family protein [Spirochaetia bacterium]